MGIEVEPDYLLLSETLKVSCRAFSQFFCTQPEELLKPSHFKNAISRNGLLIQSLWLDIVLPSNTAGGFWH